ncbi:DGC domain protein [Methanobacterium lacus]|uniref:DGC domain protein n=1 Tax=Methanobacterium lacus (strain AL-21) TaxID=877455 RepID=F0TAK8_METLA|nr:putative zinc-binding protein [Methanobacterium lacus]ADZ10080.1 DGC domain protein [Methanobacterium lacus]
MEKKKYALAPCSGMSPYGLITRAASSDVVRERDDLISICMGATSADREGFKELIKKYPIIAVNGCEGACVDKILLQKGVKVSKVVNAQEELNSANLKPTDPVRLDENGEKCVELLKQKITKLID